MQQQKI